MLAHSAWITCADTALEPASDEWPIAEDFLADGRGSD